MNCLWCGDLLESYDPGCTHSVTGVQGTSKHWGSIQTRPKGNLGIERNSANIEKEAKTMESTIDPREAKHKLKFEKIYDEEILK